MIHSSDKNHYDIIVVGAGLVGASFTALLAVQTHLRIALIDGGAEPSLPSLEKNPPEFDPRVVALTHASQSMFEHLGVWETIQSQRACAYTKMHVWDNDGTARIDFDADEIHQEHLGHIVENSLLQCAVLDKIQQQQHITLLRGVQVVAIDHQAESTLVRCDDGITRSATLLVAADGGQSKIRELENIKTREWDYQHKAIVATVRSSDSHQYTAWQNFLSSGPLAFLPLDHASEEYCSIVWSLETEKADAIMALDEDKFCTALARAFEHRLGDVQSVSQRFCFPLQQRHAVEYSHHHTVLIGDAAHTIHPLAGQGVNLGLLDAQALAVEINRAVERNLPINHASILRRYQRQRKANNLEVMLLMEGFKRLFGSRLLLVRWLRNVGVRKVNSFPLLKNWLARQAIKNNG